MTRKHTEKRYGKTRKDAERYKEIKRETNWNLFLISSKIVLKQNNSESRSIIFAFYKKCLPFPLLWVRGGGGGGAWYFCGDVWFGDDECVRVTPSSKFVLNILIGV